MLIVKRVKSKGWSQKGNFNFNDYFSALCQLASVPAQIARTLLVDRIVAKFFFVCLIYPVNIRRINK